MNPSIFARLRLALRVLFDPAFARRAFDLDVPALPQGPNTRTSDAPPEPAPANDDAALVLLSLLQREGRFVDFVMQDIESFGDAEIGSVARVVHQGCRRALRGHLTLDPVRIEAEGNRVTVEPGFDRSSIKLTGNVSGAAPYRGILRHRGWRALETHLPEIVGDHDVRVVAPAELEVE